MPLAAIYCRQSFFREDSCSIDMQIERAKAFCVSKGWNYEIYIDKGFSGKNTSRPDFQRLMSNLEDIDYVVVYRMDRISRNLKDFFNLMEEFESKKIGFQSLNENFDTTTPMGRAMLAIIAVFAQLERETIAERVRDNMLDRARKGIWNGGPVPFGFELGKATINGKQRSILLPNKREQKLVLQFYNWYLEPEGSIRQLTKKLNALAVPTKTGNKWNPNQVSRILRNPLYCIADSDAYRYFSNLNLEMASQINEFNGQNGLMYYNRRKPKNKTTEKRKMSEWILVVGNHQGCVPGKLFIQVQNKLRKSKNTFSRSGKGKKGLLISLLKCDKCGGAMSYKDYGKSTWQYYFCNKAYFSGTCEGQTVKGDDIEKVVIETIRTICSDKNLLKQVAAQAMSESKEDTTPLKKEKKELLSKIEAVISEQKELVKALGKKTLPGEIIEERINELEENKKTLQNELELIEAQLNQYFIQDINIDLVFNNLLQFNNIFDEMTFEEKRAFLRSVIKEIRYNEGIINIHLYFTPDIQGLQAKVNQSGSSGKLVPQGQGFMEAINPKFAG